MRVPLPSACLHPTLTPWENQKQAWPLLHGEVPLLHLHVYGSIVPVAGCFPPAHGIPGEASSEFRDGGMIIDPWPLAREEKSWSILRG